MAMTRGLWTTARDVGAHHAALTGATVRGTGTCRPPCPPAAHVATLGLTRALLAQGGPPARLTRFTGSARTFGGSGEPGQNPDSLSLSPGRLSEEGANLLGKLAGSTGFEPAASGVTGRTRRTRTPTGAESCQRKRPYHQTHLGLNCSQSAVLHGQKTDRPFQAVNSASGDTTASKYGCPLGTGPPSPGHSPPGIPGRGLGKNRDQESDRQQATHHRFRTA